MDKNFDLKESLMREKAKIRKEDLEKHGPDDRIPVDLPDSKKPGDITGWRFWLYTGIATAFVILIACLLVCVIL